MEETKLLQQARSVYETICKSLDNRDWKYERHDDDLTILSEAQGEDLPVSMIIRVDPNAQVVSLYSPMPFNIAEEKRIDAAIAVCVANYGLINGSFDYDLNDGEIRFRLVTSFRESMLSEELFMYMVLVAAATVDDYNDKFLMVSKGIMSIQSFIEWEQQRKNG